MENHIKAQELTEKIKNGVEKAIQKMIERSKKLDEKIAISRDGKVLVINARDLDNQAK